MFNSGRTSEVVENGGILSKEQLIYLFSHAKKRISDAVKDKQEAVAITTAIQEEILTDMGVDPRFGIACLGKVNHVYENDQDLMIKFYGFVAREEIVCDEAEIEPDELAEKMHFQHKLQEQQLEMLKHMRKFHPDDQSEILEKLHRQMENANFDNNAAVFMSIIRKKASLPFINTR
ncbi:hypothetical protein MKX01_038891 [Papaver californicum]|nr:hypothetical protein MKX01_038891 [Papaver californicum]